MLIFLLIYINYDQFYWDPTNPQYKMAKYKKDYWNEIGKRWKDVNEIKKKNQIVC